MQVFEVIFGGLNACIYCLLQFCATAPTGIMSTRCFSETLENLVSVTYGMEQLPDLWMRITPSQVSGDSLLDILP